MDESESIADPELLMAVMQVREEIEEAQDSFQIEAIAKENKGKAFVIMQFKYLPWITSTDTVYD